jgi:hypothetical protein
VDGDLCVSKEGRDKGRHVSPPVRAAVYGCRLSKRGRWVSGPAPMSCFTVAGARPPWAACTRPRRANWTSCGAHTPLDLSYGRQCMTWRSMGALGPRESYTFDVDKLVRCGAGRDRGRPQGADTGARCSYELGSAGTPGRSVHADELVAIPNLRHLERDIVKVRPPHTHAQRKSVCVCV